MCVIEQGLKMQTITLEPLRGHDEPARIVVQLNGSQPAVYYQVLSPRSMAALCCGRPVEELPRIVPILGASHHLAAACALDRLFGVEPPELARNMRSALLQAQFCSAHLRKFYFLLTTGNDPFADFRHSARGVRRSPAVPQMLEKVMHHLGLAQEAEDILGGRHDHPLTAVAGGVSRFLKEGHYPRLARISEALQALAQELFQFTTAELLSPQRSRTIGLDLKIPELAAICLAADDQVTIGGAPRREVGPFSAETLGDHLGLQTEPWTYQSFAFLKEIGWQGLESPEGFFCTGPLARFNCAQTAATPLAEEARQKLIDTVGAPPQFTLAAAIGTLGLEILQAAELLQSLCTPEKLSGPALRNIPKGLAAQTTWAALEAPQGLIWHRYRVDGQGIVQALEIIDAGIANNALKCLLARQLVGAALAEKLPPAVIQERLAVAFLPF
jgi:F420-non-reducing hydrogenase large subunit